MFFCVSHLNNAIVAISLINCYCSKELKSVRKQVAALLVAHADEKVSDSDIVFSFHFFKFLYIEVFVA